MKKILQENKGNNPGNFHNFGRTQAFQFWPGLHSWCNGF
jgi:hypothetical protein